MWRYRFGEVRKRKVSRGKVDAGLDQVMSAETSSHCRTGQQEPVGLWDFFSSIETNCALEEHAGNRLLVQFAPVSCSRLVKTYPMGH